MTGRVRLAEDGRLGVALSLGFPGDDGRSSDVSRVVGMASPEEDADAEGAGEEARPPQPWWEVALIGVVVLGLGG
ncbi:hypothetical protein ACYOEI_42940, partial [Singulisphaera rosea]